MAHLALFTIPAYGHVFPTLEAAAELIRRGHRVTVAATEQFAPLVERTGARVLRYESNLTPKPRTEDPPADFAAWLPLVLVMESAATLPHFERSFGDDVPDLIVYDRTIYATGRVLGAKWQCPAVELFTSFAYNDQWSLATFAGEAASGVDEHPARVAFREKLAELTAAHGVAPIAPEDFIVARPEFSLVVLPREFQYAGDTFDERFAFVGPCLGGRSFQGTWQPPANGAPIVYISLGTAMNNHPEFFRTAIRAVTATGWHAVVSTGGVDLAQLGAIPPNVEVYASVPQWAVLEHAAVFVTHSGMGGTMEALARDTPMVTIPQSVEQAAVANRVAELGAGVNLAGTEVTVSSLRAAIDSVHHNSTYRSAARDLGAIVRATGGAVAAADELETYLKSAR
ncbi:glycosyltransferase [Rugosimonospora acidiphila]|uniref:Glycosyltransferase n=1 Tax=Rugosimonospora acidiphila TaxID=556531 RepID=A0ABP9STJ0_9ACTN